MVNRAFRFLSSEVRGLQQAVYVLAISALLSSLLALLRDRLLAHAFGASTTLDLYYASFRIPDFIFVGTGALVSVYMLIPELAKRSHERQQDYIDTIIVGFLGFSVVVALVAAVVAPFILSVLFPQFVLAHTIDTVVLLTRIMLMQPILLGLSNILAAITQSKHRYVLYSMSPLLYNVGIICGVLLLYPLWGMAGLAWGVVCGALMHVAIQVPSIISDGFFHRMPRFVEQKALVRTVTISIPRALALSMNQITFIGLTAIASGLAPGSIAVFMFAYNLQAVPLSIIGASYSVAAFPSLATALSRGHVDAFIEHIALSARYVFFWSMPMIGLVVILRAYAVRVILGSGQFDWTDTRLTAAAFALLICSLSAQGIVLLIVRGYYAAGRTFVPFLISLCGAALTVALAGAMVASSPFTPHLHALEVLLRVQDVPGTAVLALAFAYALANIGVAIALVIHFEQRFGGFVKLIVRSFWESIAAGIAAGVGAYATIVLVGPITLASTTASVFTRGLFGTIAGIIAAIIAYSLLGSREFIETYTAIATRLSREKAAIEEEGVATSVEESGPSAH